MPYNATWIEPWMRPLKQIPRSKRTRKVVFHKLSNRDKLETIRENSQEILNQGSNKNGAEKRRATRLRRISASRNWSNELNKSKTNLKSKKSTKKSTKTKKTTMNIPLGSKI